MSTGDSESYDYKPTYFNWFITLYACFRKHDTELQIREGIKNNSNIIFLISEQNHKL